jgi:hypothetical protein
MLHRAATVLGVKVQRFELGGQFAVLKRSRQYDLHVPERQLRDRGGQ